MATHRLRMVEEKQINDLLEPEHLIARVPRFETFFQGVREMRDLVETQGFKGKFTNKGGFWETQNMQRVASIPYSIAAAILEVDPDFFKDRGKVYRFLAQHPEYDTRPKH